LLIITSLLFLDLRRTPSSTLFPYTTLFRSAAARQSAGACTSAASTPTRSCGTTARRAPSSMPSSPRSRPAPCRSSSCHRRRPQRSEEHTSELQSLAYLVCRLLLEKKKNNIH